MELISREAVTDIIQKEMESVTDYLQHDVLINVEFEVYELPTVEAKEVVHAKWEECAWVEFDGIHCGVYTYPNGGLACSNCHHAFKKELLCPDNFCPNCGADMRTSAE